RRTGPDVQTTKRIDDVPFMLAYEALLAVPLGTWCLSGRFRRFVRTPVRLLLLILDVGLFIAVGVFLAPVVGLCCIGFSGGPTRRGGVGWPSSTHSPAT